MAQALDQPPVDDRPQRRADDGQELGEFGQIDVVAVLPLEGPPVEVVEMQGVRLGVPVVQRRQDPGPVRGVREGQLEDVQDEEPLGQLRPVVAEDGGDLEQQLDLEAHQEGEIGRRRQEAPGPGDPALGRGGLPPAVDGLGRLGAALVEGEVQERRAGREVRPGQQGPGHALDGGGDGGVDLLGDQAVDALLGGAGQAVEGAGWAEEVGAPGVEIEGEVAHLESWKFFKRDS